jgi:MOSC domain-containing protein YiiM
MNLLSINIGQARSQQRKDKDYVEITGIYKVPVTGPVAITTSGIEADAICDTKNHGGPDQALYVYGATDYEWWSRELGRELSPGTFGDNLTISGLASTDLNIGDLLHIDDVTLQVTAPRIPCGTFATRMDDPQWVKKFRIAERPGVYCRVLKTGVLQSGALAILEHYKGTTISILQSYCDYYDKHKSMENIRTHLAAPLAARLRTQLEEQLAKASHSQE